MAKLADLMLGPSAGRDFAFSRNTSKGPVECKVHIRPLTGSESDRARVNAEQYVTFLDPQKVAATKRDELIFDAEQYETLALALRDPDAHDEPWAGPEQLRSKLTTNECATLLRAYHDVVDELGPGMSVLTKERYEGLVEACAADASDRPLSFCDSRMRSSFVGSMAAELWTSRTAKSSPSLDYSEPEIAS